MFDYMLVADSFFPLLAQPPQQAAGKRVINVVKYKEDYDIEACTRIDHRYGVIEDKIEADMTRRASNQCACWVEYRSMHKVHNFDNNNI